VNQQVCFVPLNGESAVDSEFSSWSGENMGLTSEKTGAGKKMNQRQAPRKSINTSRFHTNCTYVGQEPQHKQRLIRAWYAFHDISNPLL
jgi:hypothetical protein